MMSGDGSLIPNSIWLLDKRYNVVLNMSLRRIGRVLAGPSIFFLDLFGREVREELHRCLRGSHIETILEYSCK
jgi:hypothetical protein